MVGCENHQTPHGIELRHVAVHHGVKLVGTRGAWCEFVLDVICGREVHHIGSLIFHQPHTGCKNKFRQVCAVHTGQSFANFVQHIIDAMLCHRGLVCFFCRKTNAFHVVTQQLPQLVFGCNDSHFATRIGQCSQQRRRTQPLRIIHHDFNIVGAVVQIIAANAMHTGRRACHDGQIIGVGKTGHHTIGLQARALCQYFFHPRHVAPSHSLA